MSFKGQNASFILYLSTTERKPPSFDSIELCFELFGACSFPLLSKLLPGYLSYLVLLQHSNSVTSEILLHLQAFFKRQFTTIIFKLARNQEGKL